MAATRLYVRKKLNQLTNAVVFVRRWALILVLEDWQFGFAGGHVANSWPATSWPSTTRPPHLS